MLQRCRGQFAKRGDTHYAALLFHVGFDGVVGYAQCLVAQPD